MNLESIRLQSEGLASEYEPLQPIDRKGLLIRCEGGFERYHGVAGKKLWDASGYKRISLAEAFERAIVAYAIQASEAQFQVTAEWVTNPIEPYTRLTRFGMRNVTPVKPPTADPARD